MPVQVTTNVLSIYLVGKQAWQCFGGIIRTEVCIFHPYIAMPNLEGLPPFAGGKNGFRQVPGGDTRGGVNELTRDVRADRTASAGGVPVLGLRT